MLLREEEVLWLGQGAAPRPWPVLHACGAGASRAPPPSLELVAAARVPLQLQLHARHRQHLPLHPQGPQCVPACKPACVCVYVLGALPSPPRFLLHTSVVLLVCAVPSQLLCGCTCPHACLASARCPAALQSLDPARTTHRKLRIG